MALNFSLSVKCSFFCVDIEITGVESKSRIPDEETNWNTAYHESGHVLVAHYTKDAHLVHKVTKQCILIL